MQSSGGAQRDGSLEQRELLLLSQLLAAPSRLYFLLEIFLFGAGMSIIEKCLFVYAIDELGASPLLCGLTVLSTTLPELPVFYLGDGLIRRIGRDACFVIALAAYALRVGAYCLLSTGFATPLLLIELLHGIIYALGWLVAVDYWREQVPAAADAGAVPPLLCACRARAARRSRGRRGAGGRAAAGATAAAAPPRSARRRRARTGSPTRPTRPPSGR